jgi:murein L,D-transpeptidase YafK
MRLKNVFVMISLLLTLSSCSFFNRKLLPEVTQIQVYKADRKLLLLHQNKVIKKYDFKLGFAPVGHKEFQGDGKTPEGQYYIDRKNPKSQFYLSIGISYPNAQDRVKALALGKDPGGDIFIHGTPKEYARSDKDWTWGCIAVTNREMDEIYEMVSIGTTIWIFP